MITIYNEKKLAEVKAEAEQHELEKGIHKMLLTTVMQLGEQLEELSARVDKIEQGESPGVPGSSDM